jgi:hypothetical protein
MSDETFCSSEVRVAVAVMRKNYRNPSAGFAPRFTMSGTSELDPRNRGRP